MVPMQETDVPLRLIDPPARAARDEIDPEKLASLADDIGANGLLQRIGLVGPSPAGRYETVWGHRRLEAMKLLDWPMAPAKLAPWGTSPTAMRAAENFVREQLNPREEARQVRELLADGMPLPHVARVLRRSPEWCAGRAEILDWPEELQEAVAVGALPLTVARQLAGIDHDGYRAQLVAEAQRTGANGRQVAVWLAHYQADRDRIVANHDTVAQILERREEFIILFRCECCGGEFDTRQSVLLRICSPCNRRLQEPDAAAS